MSRSYISILMSRIISFFITTRLWKVLLIKTVVLILTQFPVKNMVKTLHTMALCTTKKQHFEVENETNPAFYRPPSLTSGLHQLGISALHVSVRANAVELVRKLLTKGAVPNHVQLFSETPLHTAAAMGYDECVQLLIEHGASMEVLMGPTKMTALHLGMHHFDCNYMCEIEWKPSV